MDTNRQIQENTGNIMKKREKKILHFMFVKNQLTCRYRNIDQPKIDNELVRVRNNDIARARHKKVYALQEDYVRSRVITICDNLVKLKTGILSFYMKCQQMF